MALDIKGFFKRAAQGEIPAELRALGVDSKVFAAAQREAEAVDAKGPTIAYVGDCGVGKSSTLNALFNAGREISHVRPCTKEPGEVRFEIGGAKGAITAIDMPGLGESIKADKVHYEKYIKWLPQCDVTLWLFQADFRAMTNSQIYLKRLVEDGVLTSDRLVVGINKVDLIQPGNWLTEANLPSDEQDSSIAEYVRYVHDVLDEIGININNRVVPYSARMKYDLHKLFHAMLSACPKKRLWVLFNRKELADYRDLVNPNLLK